MPPLRVVVHLDVLKDFSLRIRLIFEGAILKQLGLKAAEAGLHEGIVVGVVGPAHALA